MSKKVQVIEPLVYAGPGWQALPKSAEGDIITVATARYAEELVEAGLVKYVVEEEPAEPKSVEQPTDGQTDPKADGDNGSEDGQTTADSEPPDGSEPDGGETADGEAQGLSGLLEKWVVDLLVKEGLDTPSKVAAATDKQLLGITNIGKKTLADIRAKITK